MSTLAYDIQTDDQPTLRRWTRDEYYRMAEVGLIGEEDRVELIEGEIVRKMSPQKSPHTVVVQIVQQSLIASFGPDYHVRAQFPILIEGDSEPEPDAVVARGNARRFLQSHPTAAEIVLVVEVSDSTLSFDRGRKARLYARGGIADYWIVNLVDRRVEVMSNPVEDLGYRTITLYREGESIQPPILGTHPIPVADLLP